MKLKQLNQTGFTLVEVLVMAPILMITVVFMMSFLFNQYGQLTQQGALLNLQVEAQNIVFSMQDDLFFANEFSSDKNANLSDSFAPAGGWTYNTTPQTLIISEPASTKNRRDANRTPVYINTLGCTPGVSQDTMEENSVLYNNTIYFVSGTTLYKRYLTAPAALSTCGSNWQPQTCPPANATAACPSDRVLTDKLNTFTVTYYDTSNAVVTTPEQAEKVKVDIQLKDKAYAEDIYANNTITMRKLNQ